LLAVVVGAEEEEALLLLLWLPVLGRSPSNISKTSAVHSSNFDCFSWRTV
jgi:hypothetical protein